MVERNEYLKPSQKVYYVVQFKFDNRGMTSCIQCSVNVLLIPMTSGTYDVCPVHLRVDDVVKLVGTLQNTGSNKINMIKTLNNVYLEMLHRASRKKNMKIKLFPGQNC